MTCPLSRDPLYVDGLREGGVSVHAPTIRGFSVAASGGVVGTVGFPAFLTWDGQPSLDRFIDDIACKADLVGIDHAGLGIDYHLGQ
ncbi:MAG: membrane dipeptidase [Pseudomonadota bacterium]